MTIKLSGLRAPVDIGSNHLDDLANVNVPSPNDGDMITYDFGSAKWINIAPPYALATDVKAEQQIVETGTTFTITASHAGKTIYFTNAANIAIDLSDGLAQGFQCVIKQVNTGIPTVTPDTDTINGAGDGVAPAAAYKAMHLAKYSSTEWFATL